MPSAEPTDAPLTAIPAGKAPLSPRAAIPAVAAGGAIGALARFGVELGLVEGLDSALLAASLSLGLVNALGSAGLGALIGRLERRAGPAWMRPFLGIGALGAFTTFSGFVAHLRVLHAEAGAAATAAFFVASCVGSVLLFHAAHGTPAPAEADR